MMETFIVLNIVIYLIVAFALMAFGVFAIGFVIGYKREEHILLKRKKQNEKTKPQESDKEKRAKKEWKKFLEYDGSTPPGVE